MPLNNIPADRSYTDEHEWIMISPGQTSVPTSPVRVGITSVAAAALGELVFLDLPEVGSEIEAGRTCGEVESTKTVSDLYPPVSGEVTSLNQAAIDDPSLVTQDPYGSGWLFEVQPTQLGTLLTAQEYAEKNGA
ncbi:MULTISPECIES: glycine cleavage system protein GcvH [Mycolicibacterium]|jgi:glycine cleavage system H protein|uniref:Glycine cleavage system H protein n=1 Tax=Mycolicibacterium chlorophenolicum TaxID=37916 RepID=A0A0J6W9C2_9MYCO|nr:glycine cleavage system protein GcvH [Mycolicibacterium chlorophenolicum]KMO79169.1 Glycine cleavage system H protein [Mycolicibacterium chlorophenolicum]